ncbi:MAG: SUMF1/EgtB/PvdO family nonheme iron enzyme [Magnetococcales bacterium]|nr:SUMF1/EgtB/PvdO family nonheme iron enzyme [Magnetococcales bacterium]
MNTLNHQRKKGGSRGRYPADVMTRSSLSFTGVAGLAPGRWREAWSVWQPSWRGGRKGWVSMSLLLPMVGWISWFFPSDSKEPVKVADLPWKSCLLLDDDGSAYPDLTQIPAGELAISGDHANGLSPYLKPHGLERVHTETPFLIQRHEVTREQFKRYVDFVGRLPDGSQKSERLLRIGRQWQGHDTGSQNVSGVSWEGAWDYTDWLSQQTGCEYRLPSREEWGAAVIHHFNDNPSMGRNTPLDRLLRGVREWSRSSCPSGYYLLGEDDWTAMPNVGQLVCMPQSLAVAGFRVVLGVAGGSLVPANAQPGDS